MLQRHRGRRPQRMGGAPAQPPPQGRGATWPNGLASFMSSRATWATVVLRPLPHRTRAMPPSGSGS
eukprot:6983030-Pyramimonas_sp.AAC.1